MTASSRIWNAVGSAEGRHVLKSLFWQVQQPGKSSSTHQMDELEARVPIRHLARIRSSRVCVAPQLEGREPEQDLGPSRPESCVRHRRHDVVV